MAVSLVAAFTVVGAARRTPSGLGRRRQGKGRAGQGRAGASSVTSSVRSVTGRSKDTSGSVPSVLRTHVCAGRARRGGVVPQPGAVTDLIEAAANDVAGQ